jgi:hypothetical protein
VDQGPWSRRLSVVVAVVMALLALALVALVVLLGPQGEAALREAPAAGTGAAG